MELQSHAYDQTMAFLQREVEDLRHMVKQVQLEMDKTDVASIRDGHTKPS